MGLWGAGFTKGGAQGAAGSEAENQGYLEAQRELGTVSSLG